MLYEEPDLIVLESITILELAEYLTVPVTPSAKLIAAWLLPDTNAFYANSFDKTIAL